LRRPGERKMKITTSLNEKIVKAVRISMQIEGYKPTQSQEIKQRAKTLMEQQHVQVSVPGK
jgi:hypothetical protein